MNCSVSSQTTSQELREIRRFAPYVNTITQVLSGDDHIIASRSAALVGLDQPRSCYGPVNMVHAAQSGHVLSTVGQTCSTVQDCTTFDEMPQYCRHPSTCSLFSLQPR